MLGTHQSASVMISHMKQEKKSANKKHIYEYLKNELYMTGD